jgi:hypothetical protein
MILRLTTTCLSHDLPGQDAQSTIQHKLAGRTPGPRGTLPSRSPLEESGAAGTDGRFTTGKLA